MMLQAWLFSKGLAGLSRWVWIAIAAVGTVLLVWAIVDAIGDAREAEIEQARTRDALEAERRASAGEETRRKARETASDATTKELEAINEQDPDNAVRPASRSDRAVAERLRAQ